MLRKVLITDDHSMLRFGLAQTLRSLLPDCTVLEAASRLQTLALLQEHADVDLLLLDLNLGDARGLRTAQEIVEIRPLLPVAIVTSDDDPTLARRALEMGLVGFLPKSSDANLTANALRLLLSGGSYWPREALQPGSGSSGLSSLGPRQHGVLRGLCRGLSNKQIAHELGITEATVKAHLTTVFRVLRVNSRSQAIAWVHRQGDLADDPAGPG